MKPDLLLFDEPLSNLDAKLRVQVRGELRRLQKRLGTTAIYVTHDQDEAMMMSDRIAVMTDGEIAQIGSPSEVYLHPDTPFVAGFLGETNLLPVLCQGIDGGQALVRYANGMLGSARLPHSGSIPQAGDRALVSVRPERVRFVTGCSDAVEGAVIGHAFLGRHVRTVVRAMNQAMVVSTTDIVRMAPGDIVRLGWDNEDAQLLAGSGSTTGGGSGDIE
jgi:ABC-type Fe3+/spermidine/putrescine transport system ATPase subunit